MPRTKWDKRDRWRIPSKAGDHGMEWYAAPGTVRMDATAYNDWFDPLPEPFWAIGTLNGRWWANMDSTPELHWFDTEQEAMAFVEVMIRMA